MNRYIKVDDIIIIKGIPHVVKEVKPGTTTVESVIRGRQLMYSNQNLFEYLPDYREMYEQEKQRADNLDQYIDRCNDVLGQYIELLKADIAKAKKRADAAENKLDDLEEFIPSLRAAVESTLNYSHPNVDPDLQSDIGAYSGLMQQILENLERGEE